MYTELLKSIKKQEDGKIQVYARGAEAFLKISDIEATLSRRSLEIVGEDERFSERNNVRIVALVFSPSGSSIMEKQLIPRFHDIHVRSAGYIDFFSQELIVL